MSEKWITCGKEYVDWDFAVVYVSSKKDPYVKSTKLLFYFPTPKPDEVTFLDESARLVDQWTYTRGVCHNPVRPKSHEYNRSKKMACQVVATFRRHYLDRHQAPPLIGTLTGGAWYGIKKTGCVVAPNQNKPVVRTPEQIEQLSLMFDEDCTVGKK